MRNSRLLPYETIVQATSGEPEAVNLVLQHYRGYIRYVPYKKSAQWCWMAQ